MAHEASIFQGYCFLLWGDSVGWWTEPLGRDYGDLKCGLEQAMPCNLSSHPFSETTHPPGLMHGFSPLAEGVAAN